jgi:pre-mRNA-splicing factor ISY1
MARNEEKANASLNRWVTMKREQRLGFHSQRPRRTTMVSTLSEAERWRMELVREISQKVTEIQNREPT